MSWRRLLGRERIEELHPRVLEIRDIPCHHGQAMALGGGGELAIEGRDVHSLLLEVGDELPPNMGGAGVEAEDSAIHALANCFEPRLES